MKKSLVKIMMLVLLASLVLTACGKKEEPEEADIVALPIVEQAASDADAVDTDQELDQLYPAEVVEQTAAEKLYPADIDFEALITEKIGNNHTLDFILNQDKTAEEWSETLDRMIGYGADISPEEKALIIEWLTSRK